MSKSWEDKGWNNMASILDEAMPVRRAPLFPGFPIQLRIATFVLLIAGSAYWGFKFLNQETDQLELSAFNFNLTTENTSAESDLKSHDPTHRSAKTSENILAPRPFVFRANSVTPEAMTSIPDNVEIQMPLQSGLVQSDSETHNYNVADESAQKQDITFSLTVIDHDDAKLSEVSVINSANQANVSDESQFISDEKVTTETLLDQPESVLAEADPIVNPRLNTSFSLGASAGNFSFSNPTLYGQIQLNMHIPISKSLNLTILAAAGKGLLYQNTEVLLAEYSKNPNDGSVLNAEAPGDDLSAYVDVKSVSNALIGTQIQWQISNKWSFAIGAGGAYLFNIQYQAIQSTSLVPEGQSPQQIFTPSEIDEKFAHFNNWDLRINSSLQYHMTQKWSMAFSYNRGFNNLLKHPISSEHHIRMNSLALGLNYKF